MPTKTTATSGRWSNTSTWVGGIIPVNTDTIAIDTGHALTFDADISAWTNGVVGISIGTNAVLTFDTTIHTNLKVKGNITAVDNTARILIGTEVSPVVALNDGTPETVTINFNGAFSINNVPILAYGEIRDLYDSVASNAIIGTNQVVLTNGLSLQSGDVIVIENSSTSYPGKYSSSYTVLSYVAGSKTITLSTNLIYNIVVGDKVTIIRAPILIKNNAYGYGSGYSYTGNGEFLNVFQGVRFYYHRTAGIQTTPGYERYLIVRSCVFDGCYAGFDAPQTKISDSIFYNCNHGLTDASYLYDWGGDYPNPKDITGYTCERPYVDNCIFIHCTNAISTLVNSYDILNSFIINCSYAFYRTYANIVIDTEIHNVEYALSNVMNSFYKNLTITHGNHYPLFSMAFVFNTIIDGLTFTDCIQDRILYFSGNVTIRNATGLNNYAHDFSQFNSNITLIDCDLNIEDVPPSTYPDVAGNYFHMDEAYPSYLNIKNYDSTEGYDVGAVGGARFGTRDYVNVPPGFTYGLVIDCSQNSWWEDFIQPSYYQVPITLQYLEKIKVQCMVKKTRNFDITNPVIQLVDAIFDPIIAFNRNVYSPLISDASTSGVFDWEELTFEYQNITHIQPYKYYLRFYAADTNIIDSPTCYMNWLITRTFPGVSTGIHATDNDYLNAFSRYLQADDTLFGMVDGEIHTNYPEDQILEGLNGTHQTLIGIAFSNRTSFGRFGAATHKLKEVEATFQIDVASLYGQNASYCNQVLDQIEKIVFYDVNITLEDQEYHIFVKNIESRGAYYDPELKCWHGVLSVNGFYIINAG